MSRHRTPLKHAVPTAVEGEGEETYNIEQNTDKEDEEVIRSIEVATVRVV